MKITEEIINQILSECESDNQAKYLAEEIEKIQTICSSIKSLQYKIKSIREEESKRVKKVEDSIRHIQTTCKHQGQTYCGDASGNNESYTICNICEKDVIDSRYRRS